MRKFARGLSVVAVLFLSVDCGRTHSPLAPTGAPLPTSSPTTGTATITGTLKMPASAASVRPRGIAAGLTVSIVGTALSAPIDTAGAFTIAGVPPLDVVLKFEGAGVNASVSLGAVRALEQIVVAVTIAGSTATIDLQQRTGTDSAIEADGRIDDLDATPRRFLLAGVIVDASAAAIHRADGTAMVFADLRRGDRVHVRGTREGTLIHAVEVVDGNAAAPPVTFDGTIAGVAGSCPTVTITVSGVSGLSTGTRNLTVNVSATSATAFTGKACPDMRSGDPVRIVALRQADDSLVASAVEARNPPPVEFSGTVAAISGGCPAVTISLTGVSGLSIGAVTTSLTVVANGATTWPTKTCDQIRSGDSAGVTASRQPDGSYLATRFDAKSPPAATVTLSGTIASVGGACPSLTLSMTGVSGLSIGPANLSATVVTTAGTMWAGESCGAVKRNDSATVVATRQTDGTYLASKVDAKPPATYTVSGTVTSIAGACPSLTLIVAGVTISTNGATTFVSEGCAAIKVGDAATVVKVVQADGSYLALSVDAKAPAPVTFSGTIAAVSGTCPALTISMTGVSGLAAVSTRTYTATVTTNGSTLFPTLGCTSVAPGRSASVGATRQNDGSYLASSLDAR